MGKKTQSSASTDRRQATRERIENLVAQRQALWLLYERIAGVGPYEDQAAPGKLPEFVQLLVDYIAAGHFGLYERIVSGQERRQGVVEVAREIYPQIAATTDAAVAFNDKYEGEDPVKMTDELATDLSSLGEAFATRTELEDRLIAKLFETA